MYGSAPPPRKSKTLSMTCITTPNYLSVASENGAFWGQKKLFSEGLSSGLSPRKTLLTNRNDDPIDNVPVDL